VVANRLTIVPQKALIITLEEAVGCGKVKPTVSFEDEVNLRPTVSRPVCPGVGLPSGIHDQTPSLTRGSICNLLVQLLLGLVIAVALGFKSRKTHDHILLSHLRLPQLGGPGPRRDLQTPTVTEKIRRYSSQYSARLSAHPNGLVVNLTKQPDNRRLRRHLPNDQPTRLLV
jgi:hypothetical protein